MIKLSLFLFNPSKQKDKKEVCFYIFEGDSEYVSPSNMLFCIYYMIDGYVDLDIFSLIQILSKILSSLPFHEKSMIEQITM